MSNLQRYLPLYFIAYLSLAFAWPSYRKYRKAGIKPVTFGKAANAHDYIGKVIKMLIVLLLLSILLFAFIPGWYGYLVPITTLSDPYCCYTGLVLIHLSMVWIAVAQFQMADRD